MKLLDLIFSYIVSDVHAQEVNLVSPTSPFYNIETLTMGDFIRVGVSLAFGIAGILAFLYMLLGGIQWITAGGDKEAVEKGRRKIIQAIIGLVVIFSVYVIANIINWIFGINILYGNLPSI